MAHDGQNFFPVRGLFGRRRPYKGGRIFCKVLHMKHGFGSQRLKTYSRVRALGIARPDGTGFEGSIISISIRWGMFQRSLYDDVIEDSKT